MITGTPPVALDPDGIGKGFKSHPHMASAGKNVLTEEEIDAYARATCGEPYRPFLRDAVARTDGRAREFMFASLLAGDGDDERQIVANAKVPLALVNGAAEPFVNIDYVSGLSYSSLWEGTHHVLPGLGHAPFWEAPAVFDPILTRFLEGVLPGTSR
jgi:pimeloyl-ACP methyl ester carboxylesterase